MDIIKLLQTYANKGKSVDVYETISQHKQTYTRMYHIICTAQCTHNMLLTKQATFRVYGNEIGCCYEFIWFGYSRS